MGGCTEEDLKRRKEYNRPVTYEHWQQALINIVNEAVQAKRSQEGRRKRKESVRQQECVGGIKRKKNNPEV